MSFLFAGGLEAKTGRMLVTVLPANLNTSKLVPGTEIMSRPFRNKKGITHIVWRQGTDSIGLKTVESIFLVKLDSQGRPLQKGRMQTIWQGMAMLAGLRYRGIHGAIPDGAGGFYYLWSRFLLRFDGAGRRVWPRGGAYERNTNPLYMYPSKVKMTRDEKAGIDYDVGFYPDAQGNAMTLWHNLSGGEEKDTFRASKIDAKGNMLWGNHGITIFKAVRPAKPHVITTSPTTNTPSGAFFSGAKGKYISDGRGGVIVLHISYKPGVISRLAYYDFRGKLRRRSRPIKTISVRQSAGFYHLAADGTGGLYIMYQKSFFNKNNRGIGSEVRLARFDKDAKFKFDIVVGKRVYEYRDLYQAYYLRVDDRGDALLSFRQVFKKTRENKSPRVMLHGGRYDARGRPRFKNILMRISGKEVWAGSSNIGQVDMITAGSKTLLLYENQAVFLQEISPMGRKSNGPIGRRISKSWGYKVSLIRLTQKGYGAIYFSHFGGSSAAKDLSVPFIWTP